ncbi:glucans biosynthesis glucosyltransferase MdoH [Limibaculum sp. FT325]|uniref:glucans biosynthesis glucosyltransferase MdoH n=1 Tax=Thermohalobaculum sediminis TaxID=2939436 RepID=UPI0020C0907A|nr:glucans biosynthesis glucosyltransferase MdoH [Limibaculum sediminis]MCL5779174.1 glucans biosynthesis glucosyltransferase MdoH [Limibaculum sediminis]
MPTDITPPAQTADRIGAVAAHPGQVALTPAGLQPRGALTARRAAFLSLNLATLAALGWGVAQVFGAGGWSAADIVMMACFLLGAPWTVMGVWNALVGVWLLHGRRDGLALAAPHLAAAEGGAPLTQRTAIAMTVRNEDPTRSFQKLAEIRRSLDATGQGHRFDIFVLSDTTEPEVATAEERLFEAMRPALGQGAAYRRRTGNTGFKAGNVRDFLMTMGRDHSFYLPLDSDSLMSGEAIVRMQRIMEAYPRIGILQSLVVGAPATSFFARVFQFGMRHGMRSYTMGAAWWQGDCGPYWGHNALIRVQPFRRHTRLPVLPGKPPLGGHILSHDQVEAVLVRRAGYEVRVMPVETESWEENPPTLMDFTKRDLRWCQGNMQYWRLLGLRGLQPVSHFQLFAAIMMYFAAPAWMVMTVAAAARMVQGDVAGIDVAFGIAMFFVMFAVSLVPKLLGMFDILLTPGGTARYGGTARFLAGGLVETVFSILMAPVVAFRVSLFLAGLAMGKSVIWGAQNRDAYRLSWADAARGLWPQTLFGAGLFALILVYAGPGVVVWAAPMLTGLMLAIPFAVLTASPSLGRLAARLGLCAVPDERALPRELASTGYAGTPAPETPAPAPLRAA